MKTVMRIGLCLALFVAGGLTALGCADHYKYELENARAFESVPIYPGAHRVGSQTAPILPAGCDLSCQPIGASAGVAYEISDDVPSHDVIDFFVRELGESWDAHVEVVGGAPASATGGMFEGRPPRGDFVATFARGLTRVIVATRTASWYGGDGTYSVTVETRSP